MVTNTGLSGRGCSGAVLAGKLTPMSTVASGAATMKMMSSTKMTSMNGVTLISCWMSRSSPSDRFPRRTAMMLLRRSCERRRSAMLSAADHQQELRRGVIQERAVATDDANKMVVDHDRGDRGDEPHGGCQQRFGNAGSNHGEIGGVGFGNADERVHDSPDRAEQADERRGRANRRKQAGAARDAPRHRGLHAFQTQRDAFLERIVDDAVRQFGLARGGQNELGHGIPVGPAGMRRRREAAAAFQ